MFSIIGIVVVIGAVIGGYLMEHGNMKVLVQPAELVIIGGAAIGTLLIGNPLPIIIKILKNLTGILSGGKYNKTLYTNTLKMLNDLFSQGRKGGMVSLESHVEEPDKSDLFKKHEFFLKDHHAVDFVCDTMRMALSGTVSPHDLDQMIEVDLEVHHKEVSKPVSALTTVADALPGLGIVAAVLGVVITMGSLGGPPEEIGHKVAAALVGTFLGILLCYGFLSPLANNMTHINEAEANYYNCLRTGLVAFIRGAAPILAVEFSRRSIPADVRPSFKKWKPPAEARKLHKHGRRQSSTHHYHQEKGGHGGHHGGAWKVAYADFVTAMMALFIVLWLLNSTPQVKKAVAGYFRDPSGSRGESGTIANGAGENLTITKQNMDELKKKLEEAVRKTPEFQKLKNNVEITITDEGLRIELLENDKGMFFKSGSPVPTDTGKDLLIQLAKQLGTMKNPLLVEGHTDSQRYDADGYTNWELSADRANAARRIMQTSGLQTAQVAQVRGFADQRLRLKEKPLDASNRRVSIIVQYPDDQLAQLVEDKTAKKPESGKEHGGKEHSEKPSEGKSAEGKHAEGKPAEGKAAEKAAAPKAEPAHHG